MTAPTVAVTVKLSSIGGPSIAGVTVTARLDKADVYQGFVIPMEVSGVTDATGTVVLPLFPNHPTTGLGTLGSIYTVTATVPGGKTLRVTAQVPNSACSLDAIADLTPAPTLDAAQAAQASASASAAAASGSATFAAGQASLAESYASNAESAAAGVAINAQQIYNSVATANTKATEAATSATNAATSATNAAASATAADASKTAAATSATNAATSATNASTSAGNAATSATAADASKTAAQTAKTAAETAAATATTKAGEASASATAAAGSATTASTHATNASNSATAASTSATNASNSASAAATSATNAGTSATNAANSATSAANNATTASTAQGTASAAATAASGSATAAAGSATAAATSASNAAASATTAQINADSAKGSAGTAGTAATNALALYGSLAAVQAQAATTAGYALSATAQASLAASYAATAGSVAQQDLTGADAAALHRSPNAIVQTLVMDWWKDSDPSWRKRMAGASWMQEALNGTWLGWHASEMDARDYFGALGAASIVTGDSSTFTNGIGAWACGTNATLSRVNGRLRVTFVDAAVTGYVYAAVPIATVVGQRYRIAVTYSTPPSNNTNGFLIAGTGAGGATLANFNMLKDAGATKEASFVATGTTTYVGISNAGNWGVGTYMEVDDFTVTPVDLSKNPSGAYYGLSTDGKFYRLWKNFFNATDDTAYASTNFNGIATPNAIAAPDGAMRADKFSANTTNTQHWMNKSSINFVAGVTYTYTVYAKAGELSSFNAFCTTGINTGSVRFDLSGNGVVTPGGGMTGTITPDPRGNGWYICTVTFTSAATASGGVYLFQLFKGGATTFAGDGTEGMYFVDWQLEVGSASTAFEAKGVTDNQQTETFRGNTADFPALPVAVAEATRVVIYAADQPGRPMWRVLVPATNSTPTITGLAYREGCLAIVGNGGLVSTQLWNFPADKIVWKGNSNGLSVAYSPIKNGYLTTSALGVPDGGAGVVSNSATAVAMTTLPDAPVDPVTGLQVPTIAVATAGGVSVIKHDGSVVNSASTGNATQVSITPNFISFVLSGGTNWNYAFKPAMLGAGWANVSLGAGSPPGFNFSGSAIAGSLVAGRSTAAIRAGGRASMVRFNEATPSSSLVAHITDTYNTGWMAGDIRRCLLADVSTGTESSSEKVTNGGFDADLTGWTLSNTNGSTVNWSAGAAAFQSVGGGNARITQALTTVPGMTYNISLFASVANGRVSVGTAANGVDVLAEQATPTNATGAYQFTAVGATSWLTIRVGGDFAMTVDSVSVKAVAADRSYKLKPANIVGTLTKTPVATAAQLVFWSGFSATNYAQEAYSADLDPGTGPLAVSVWGSLPVTLTAAMFPAVGGSVVVNGDFSAGTASWPTVNANTTFSVAAGQATITNTATGVSGIQQNVLTGGKYYAVTINRVSASGGSGALDLGGTRAVILAGVNTYVLKAAGATFTIDTNTTTAGASITVDDISVVELGNAWAQDRSAAAGPYYRVGVNPGGFLVAELNDGTTTRTATSTVAYNTGLPFKARLQYDTSGSLTLKVNGEQAAFAPGNPLASLTNASAVLTIGNRRALDAAWPGSLALVKVGMTVPTDDAARWMYAQELAMFQPNAQITLPDSGSLVDMDYDADTNLLRVASAANESAFNGLVRVSSAPVAAGSITKLAGRMGVKLLARSTTNPGVDITIPSKNLIEELLRKAEDARRADRPTSPLDWAGGFTANTGAGAPAALQSVTPSTSGWLGSIYPSGATVIGAQFSGAGFPASTSLTSFEGTTVLRVSASTATFATGQAIAFTDFLLPLGMEVADDVSVDGVLKQEGATKAYTRLFDGFRERVRFAVAPGSTAWVRVNARKAAQ